MSTDQSTSTKIVQSALFKHLKEEPEDKESEEWRKWELDLFKLKCDKERKTVRVLKDSNSKQIEALHSQLKQAIESHEKLKQQEIAEYKLKYNHQLAEHEQKIEQLTQSLDHYKDLFSFYKTTQGINENTVALKLRILELEDRARAQEIQNQGLEDELERELVNKTSKRKCNPKIDSLTQDKKTNQDQFNQELSNLKEENLNLMQTVAKQARRITELKTMVDSLKDSKSELETKCRKLYGQIGSTARPCYKPKSTYERKPNLTQRSLNTMFYDQELLTSSSSKASTHTVSSSPMRLNSTILSRNTKSAMSETAEQPPVKTDSLVDAIPQKRPLTTTLIDKTNNLTELNKNKKRKGSTVMVKYEQIEVDRLNKVENIPPPDQKLLSTANTTTTTTTTEATQPLYNSPSKAIVKSTPKSTSTTPSNPCNFRHLREKTHMTGETCVSCANFYGTEILDVNIDGNQLQITGQDRIQLHSRHRHHRAERARTPPGFWELDFNTPERPE